MTHGVPFTQMDKDRINRERESRKMILRGVLLFLVMAHLIGATALPGQATDKGMVGKSQVVRVVTDYVRKRTENLGVEVNIRGIDYQGDVTVPAGKVDLEVIAPAQWEGWGSVNLALVVRVNDRVERNFSVRVDVEALADVVVAARPLERGEVIGRDDVVLQKRDLARISGRICKSVDEALGKRARLGIRGNAPLRVDYLEKVPLVKSGQMVTIVAENETLRLTTRGKAKNAGAEGDTVLVQNMDSGKDIPARVVDAKTVSVDF